MTINRIENMVGTISKWGPVLLLLLTNVTDVPVQVFLFFCGLVLFDPPKFLNFCSKVGFWVVGFGEGLGNFDALCVVKGFC